MWTPLSCPFQMQVWDTAGQERFRTITQSYYRSAHAAIIAYDLTRRSTFESVPHWIHEIEKYGAANLVIMLIGMAFSKHFDILPWPPLQMLSSLGVSDGKGMWNHTKVLVVDGPQKVVGPQTPIRFT